jgi:DNA-3-methyladenine glycosylase II
MRSVLSFELTAIAPFRLDFTAWALRRRPENEVDRWDGAAFRRVIPVRGRGAELSVRQTGPPENPRLRVDVTGSGFHEGAKAEIAGLVTAMLGLQVDLKPFYRIAARDPKLRVLAERFRGLKPVRFPTVFESLANAFACQQFTLAAGLQLLNRLARRGKLAVETEAGRAFGFPEPADLLRLSPTAFRNLGFSRQKTRAFRELSRSVSAREVDLETLAGLSNEDAMNFLLALRGVGRWTAEYVLLRGLGRLDVFPGDDVGAQNHLRNWLRWRKRMDYASVISVLERWQPYAGFIYFHLLLDSLAAAGTIAA